MAYGNQGFRNQHDNSNNYSYNRGGYGQTFDQGYQRGSAPRGYNRNNGGGSGKKHSGAKISRITKGQNTDSDCIVAWNYSKARGLVKLLITPYKGTKRVDSKPGKLWENWMVKVTISRTLSESITSAMVEVNSGGGIIKATIQQFGWVVNPKAPNGGYCGTFTKK